MKNLLLLLLLPLCYCVNDSSDNKPVNNSSTSQLLKDLEYLSSDSLKGRKTGTPENTVAARFIADRFKKLGLQSYTQDYFHPFSFKYNGAEVKGTNVIAFIPGTKKEAIVISAHFDHIGVADGKIFNGADDNASGTAALLELAAYFKDKKPNYTLLFAAFDGEEMMLQGSKAFVEQSPVPLQNIKLNINMDMISHNDKGELYVAGIFHYPNFEPFLPQGYKSVKLIKGHDKPEQKADDWTLQSDHGSFHLKKIPFLYFGVEDHEDYHRETDEYQNINKVFFLDAVEAIKQTITNIDKSM